jgi:hypothetical protein
MAIQGVNPSLDLKLPDLKVEETDNLADQWKNIRRKKAEREVLRDPALAKKLMAVQASPVYNSKGEVIQTTGFNVS